MQAAKKSRLKIIRKKLLIVLLPRSEATHNPKNEHKVVTESEGHGLEGPGPSVKAHLLWWRGKGTRQPKGTKCSRPPPPALGSEWPRVP